MKKKIENNEIPQDQINRIYLQDCIAGMAKLPEKSIDVIISDPPYNLSSGQNINFEGGKVVAGMGGEWKKTMEKWDNMSLSDYFSFSYSWLAEAKRVLKPTGSMWIFGTYHNLGIINVVCQLLGLEIINEVIWYKSNAFPNLSGRRLTASHETLLWVHNSPKKRQYKFNYDYSKNGDFDYDSLKAPGKQMRTVWSIPNNKERWEIQFGKHPTQKPIRLIERLIKLTTDENDIVLSPFAGAGTDCVASALNNRRYIGFEIEQDYVNIATSRISNMPVRLF